MWSFAVKIIPCFKLFVQKGRLQSKRLMVNYELPFLSIFNIQTLGF